MAKFSRKASKKQELDLEELLNSNEYDEDSYDVDDFMDEMYDSEFEEEDDEEYEEDEDEEESHWSDKFLNIVYAVEEKFETIRTLELTKTGKILIISFGAILLTAVLTFGLIWNPFSEYPWFRSSDNGDSHNASPLDNPNFRLPTENEDNGNDSDDEKNLANGINDEENSEEEQLQEEIFAPTVEDIALVAWQAQPADSMSQEQLNNHIRQELHQGSMNNILLATNRTTDQDELSIFLAGFLQRLLNPVHGGWLELQTNNELVAHSQRALIIEEAFGNANIFSDELLDRFLEHTMAIPLFDYWHLSYASKEATYGKEAIWIGEVRSLSVNEAIDNSSWQITAILRFVALTADGPIAEQQQTASFTIRNFDGDFRVTQAALTS